MPEQFDPEWEYFTPADPEIAELLGVPDCRFETLRTAGGGDNAVNLGCRYGRGNPDRYLPPEPGFVPVEDRPGAIGPGQCPTCGETFTGTHSGQIHCCRECVPRPGRVRVLKAAACGTCRKPFRRLYARQRFCCRKCVRQPPPAVDPRLERFAGDYSAGLPMSSLAAKYDVKVCQLQRWRRKLGLPPRGPRGAKSAPSV